MHVETVGAIQLNHLVVHSAEDKKGLTASARVIRMAVLMLHVGVSQRLRLSRRPEETHDAVSERENFCIDEL